MIKNKKSKSICVSNRMHKILKGLIRGILIIAGTFFVGLGVFGIFLPLLPTTPFLLLAIACYSISSKRFYNWFLNHKWFGNYIKNYLEGKGIPLTVKILCISLLWITIMFSVVFIAQKLFVRVVLISIAIGVTVHVLTIRTLKLTERGMIDIKNHLETENFSDNT